MLSAAAYALFYLVGPSAYDDDPIYLMLANQLAHSSLAQSNYIYTARLFQIIPIAIFFKLFGVGVISSGAWDFICYLGVVAVAFYFTKEVYDARAGVISAALVSIFPLLVRSATTATESVPMAFVTSLAILALLYGWRRDSAKWYLASGFIAISSFMVTPEGAIAIIFSALALAYLTLTKGLRRKSVWIICGAAVALLLMFCLNYAYFGNPLHSFTLNNAYYNDPTISSVLTSGTQGLMYYPYILFPYNNGVDINQVGPYFYFLVAATVYLLIRRESKAHFALAWFWFMLAYLEIGPMHISLYPSLGYVMIYGVARFLLITAVPMAAILGIALSRALAHEGKATISVSRAMAIIALVAIAVSSLSLNSYWHSVAYLSSYDQIAISGYLSNLPNSTTVYLPSDLTNIYSYLRFDNLSRFKTLMQIRNCTDFASGSYVVSADPFQVINSSFYHYVSTCQNLRLISLPRPSNSTPYYGELHSNIIDLNLYRVV